MIDGSKKRNHQLAFELQNSHVCEKRSKNVCKRSWIILNFLCLLVPIIHELFRVGDKGN